MFVQEQNLYHFSITEFMDAIHGDGNNFINFNRFLLTGMPICQDMERICTMGRANLDKSWPNAKLEGFT